MSIAFNIQKIKEQLPASVQLVAVSKTHPPEAVMEAYNTGQRIFGESKVQELVDKQSVLPKDIKWHMIGHLQSNKVKDVVPFVDLIHSVDSYKLLSIIDKEAGKIQRTVNFLLQVHIADEITKFGFTEEELIELLKSDEFKTLLHIRICGLMGMATFTNDIQKVRNEFKNLKRIFDKIKADYFIDTPDFKQLSMGMSDDYPIAIEERSTLIRVGSAIFGTRYYNKDE
ncbi:MAG: YggS family pyridoxal phosphate-dependent enzyme [Cytophagaceae bacterium]|jgi:pyridoxal phosphate enzyme (YggS family)|nr:YggS family pyridoxal phosphate-dependent enzyme [Cytophagaceae bacterium]